MGLDMSMSLLYYSRLRIVTNLMAFDSEQHSPTHFVSVYAGGLENKGKLNSSDLGLRQPGAYSFSSARTNITYMSTMMLEHFAKQLEGRASFVHVFPGVVVTAAMDAYSNPWWFK